MKASRHKKVKAIKTTYQPAKKEHFQVDQKTIDVDMDDILDIEIECKNGFAVFIPFDKIFVAVDGSDQVFNATQVQKDLWKVSIRRLNERNPHKDKKFAYGIYINDHDDFAVAASPPRMNVNP